MHIASAAAAPLIETYRLGTQRRLYRPAIVLPIVGGLFALLFAILLVLGACVVAGGFLPGSGFFLSQSSSVSSSAAVSFPLPLAVWSLAASAILLVSLCLTVLGMRMIVTALLYRNVCAILCDYGVAYLARSESAAFRWEQVVTVLDKVNAIHGDIGRKTASHAYTVVCNDGRRFFFDRKLARVERLGQEIQAAVSQPWQMA